MDHMNIYECHLDYVMQAAFKELLTLYWQELNGMMLFAIKMIYLFLQNHLMFIKNDWKVSKRLQNVGFSAKPSKCNFAFNRMVFLGHEISKEGIRPDKHKVNIIMNCRAPRNITELRSFLGFTGYYRKHVQNYSIIIQPLTQLLRKDVDFKFGSEQLHAFTKLKEMFSTQCPLLHILIKFRN